MLPVEVKTMCSKKIYIMRGNKDYAGIVSLVDLYYYMRVLKVNSPDGIKTIRLGVVPVVSSTRPHNLTIDRLIFPFVQFIFEGVRGRGTKGDIAIDDVKIYSGRCVPNAGGKCINGYVKMTSVFDPTKL